MDNYIIYVALTIILITLTGVLINIYVAIKIREKLNKIIGKAERLPAVLWNNANLLSAIDPVRPMPTPGVWAASSDFLITLLDLIEVNKPKVVVELGSGLSTLIIAYALKRMGSGVLMSIDHDQVYAEKTRQQIRSHGLEKFASVCVAELKSQSGIPGNLPWYDISALPDVSTVDLLVIDGPPLGEGPLVRLPALYVFDNRLRQGAIVVLDDANRPGERQIVEEWGRSFPNWSFSPQPAEKGMVVATKQTTCR